jgi:hypothetical protein
VVQQYVPTWRSNHAHFKVEQSKVPDYWGQKVTAIVFIRMIDNLARTKHWNNTTAYANVTNALKGFALDWLFATVEMLDWEGQISRQGMSICKSIR